MSLKEKVNIGVIIFFSIMFITIIVLLSFKIKNLYDENFSLKEKLTEKEKENNKFKDQIERTIKQLDEYEKKLLNYERNISLSKNNIILEEENKNIRPKKSIPNIQYILSMLYGEKADDALEKNKIKEAATNYYNSLIYYDNIGARIGATDILRRVNKTKSFLRDHTASIKSLKFSHNSKIIASGSIDRTIKLWNIKEKKLITTLTGHMGTINDIDFYYNDEFIISCSTDKTLKLWDLSSNSCVRTFEGHTDSVRTVRFFGNKFIVSGSWDNTVKIWNMETGECLKTFIHNDDINTIDISKYGNFIIFGGRSQFIRFINYNIMKEVRNFMTKDDTITSIANDGNYIAIAFDRLFSDDYSISLYDFDTGNFLKSFNGHEAVVNKINFSKKRNLLVSGSSDAKVKIWDIASGRCIKTYMEEDASIYTVDISGDDSYIIGGDSTGTIYIWETGITLSFQETLNILKKFF